MREWYSLGSGWEWMPMPNYGETWLRHHCPDGKTRTGVIEENHEIVSKPGQPLSISPSVVCECGAHGYVRDGKWQG
jgi:hypothetical protein